MNASARQLRALRQAISAQRLTTYLRWSDNNLRRAVELYAWNIRAAAALYPILHVNEVTLRNAVDRALASQFGTQWPYSGGFERSLPRAERSAFCASRSKLERTRGVMRVSSGDVVSAQSYWFWVMLLNARFEGRIWSREFRPSFPFAPPAVSRATVHAAAESIRRVRNRIAHHEPLLGHDLRSAHRRAGALIAWISREKADWTERHWPLDPALLRPP